MLGLLWKTWRSHSSSSQSVCIGKESSGITALDGTEGEMIWTGSYDLSSWTDFPAKLFPISFESFEYLDLDLNIHSGSVVLDSDASSTTTISNSNSHSHKIAAPIYAAPKIRINGTC